MLYEKNNKIWNCQNWIFIHHTFQYNIEITTCRQYSNCLTTFRLFTKVKQISSSGSFALQKIQTLLKYDYIFFKYYKKLFILYTNLREEIKMKYLNQSYKNSVIEGYT